MYNSTLNAAEASARPISESSTQLPARRPVDCVDASGRGPVFFPHGRLRFSHSEQVPLRRPSGSDIVCFGRSLCGARPYMAAWKRAGCLYSGSTPSRRSPSMRSSCYMHGGFYTAPLAAFLRQRRFPVALSLQGTARRLRSQHRH